MTEPGGGSRERPEEHDLPFGADLFAEPCTLEMANMLRYLPLIETANQVTQCTLNGSSRKHGLTLLPN
jgi:hypothetical protein